MSSSSSSGDAFFEGMFTGGFVPGGAPGSGGGVHRRGGTDESPVPGEDRQVRCKLLRADGSEWTVTGLSLGPDGLHVDAYRYVSDGRTPAETRRQRLDDELLEPDDRVWCLNRRGSVIWTLSSPDEADAVPEAGETTEGSDG